MSIIGGWSIGFLASTKHSYKSQDIWYSGIALPLVMVEEMTSLASVSTVAKKATTAPTAQSLKCAGNAGRRWAWHSYCLISTSTCLAISMTHSHSGSCEGWLPRTWQVLQLPGRRAHHCRLPWAWEVQEVQEGRPQGGWVPWAYEVWQVSVYEICIMRFLLVLFRTFLAISTSFSGLCSFLVHRIEHGIVGSAICWLSLDPLPQLFLLSCAFKP